MKRVLQSLFMALAAVTFMTGCKEKEQQPTTPTTVGISASAISGGSATITVTLSQTASSAVSVTLSATGNLASHLTFEKKVNIEAGQKSAQVPVTVATDLAAGTYEAEISISSATGATVDTSAKSAKLTLTVEGPKTAVVGISSYTSEFVDGSANIAISLSRALEEPATVTLATTANTEGYPVVDDAALTYEKTITFEPGKLTKTVVVKLDDSLLPYGESVASIKIDQVSENLTVDPNSVQADILVDKELQPNLRDDWTAVYGGQQEQEGKEKSVINISGMGTDGSFYIFIYDKGTVDYYFEDKAEYVTTMAEYVHEKLGTEEAYDIYTGDGPLYFGIMPGEYEIWLLGCDATGELNGDYAQGEDFVVEATEDAKEAYAQWLGEWKVTRGTNTEPDIWIVSECQEGVSFYINGIDGDAGAISDVFVKADYDYAEDAILLYSQSGLKQLTYDKTNYDLGLYGLFDGQIYGGDYYIAYIQKEGGNAIIKGCTQNDGSVCTGMTMFAADSEGNGYVFNKQIFYTWPETMTRVVPELGVPGYEDFLGYWSMKRNDSVWNSSKQDWDQLGEVTDTLVVVPRIVGSSYYIGGFEGYGDAIVARFNAETQTMAVKEQVIAILEDEGEEISVRLCGLINYRGKIYVWDDGDTIFTAKATPGEKISLTPESTGDYGNFVSMQYFIYYPGDDGGYSAFHDEGYDLPNQMLWCDVAEEEEEPASISTSAWKPFVARVKEPLRRHQSMHVSGNRSVSPLTVSKERVAL